MVCDQPSERLKPQFLTVTTCNIVTEVLRLQFLAVTTCTIVTVRCVYIRIAKSPCEAIRCLGVNARLGHFCYSLLSSVFYAVMMPVI